MSIQQEIYEAVLTTLGKAMPMRGLPKYDEVCNAVILVNSDTMQRICVEHYTSAAAHKMFDIENMKFVGYDIIKVPSLQSPYRILLEPN